MPDLTPLQLRMLYRMGPERAISFLDSLGIEVTWDWEEQLESVRRRAFTVAKVAKADALQTLLDELRKASRSGVSYEEWKKSTTEVLQQKGFATRDDGSAWRLDTIYRTNMQTAYQAGRYEQMKRTSDRFEFWEYRAVGDKRTRPKHRELDGLILPKDDPFWNRVFPPNGYRCFPPGTEVATPSGWRPIESIESGDPVIGGSGQVQPVVTRFARYFDGELVRVVASGEKFSATDNHRVLTLRGWVEAGSLEVGDVLVQSPEAARLDVPVHDVEQPHSGVPDFDVPLPRHRSSVPETFNPDPNLGEEHVDPVDTNVRIVLDDVSTTPQLVDHHLFMPGWIGLSGRVSPRVLSVADPLRDAHLSSNFRPPSRCRLPESLRRLRDGFARLLRDSESRVTPLSSHFGLNLPKPLAGCTAAFIGVDPLGFHGLTAVSDRDVEVAQKAYNRPVAHTPSILQEPDPALLFGVESAEGFDDAAPLAFFDSLDGFRRWARFHCVLREVESVRVVSYVGAIYNLEVESDQSYSLRAGIVHNCRCSVTALTREQALRKGYKPPKGDTVKTPGGDRVRLRGKGAWDPDEGFEGIPGQQYDPEKSKYDPKIRKGLEKDLGGG